MANKNALGSTKVRKSFVEYVNIYEVTESELNTLENGGQSALMLDIAFSLLSVAVTCIITLLTSTFSHEIVKTGFLFVAIIGIIVGGVLLILGFKQRKSVSSIIKGIKARMQTE